MQVWSILGTDNHLTIAKDTAIIPICQQLHACMHGPRPFMFYQDHTFTFRYKWSGRTIYDNITSPGDHLCCHKWSPWTTHAQTI